MKLVVCELTSQTFSRVFDNPIRVVIISDFMSFFIVITNGQ